MATTHDPPRYSNQEFLAAIDSSQFVSGPTANIDKIKVAAFEDYYQQTILRAKGGFIPYELPYPKYELLIYLTEQQ